MRLLRNALALKNRVDFFFTMWYMYDSYEDFSCLRKNYFHSFRHRFLRSSLNVLVERI